MIITSSLINKNTMLRKLVDDVLLHIKAFDGDVYGGFIRDYRIGDTVFIKDINCRIDNAFLVLFMQTLNLYFDVEEISIELGGSFVDYRKKLKVMMKENESNDIFYSGLVQRKPYVYVDVVVMSRVDLMRLPCDFDVNILAENAHSLYVRVPYNSLNKYSDRLNFVKNRVENREFCSLDDCFTKTPEQIMCLIERALRMVMKGWVMDDTLLGNKTWVLAQWSLLNNQLKMIRKKYDKDKYEKMISMTECAICNEEFKTSDIVINTKCNHNFHWNEMCASYSIRCKGLKEWVKRGNINCPICRQIMF
jgi:Ring finger domain